MRCSLSHEHFPLWTCLIGTELVSVKTIINKHLLFVLFFLPCGALLAGIHGQSVLLLLLFLLLFSSSFFFSFSFSLLSFLLLRFFSSGSLPIVSQDTSSVPVVSLSYLISPSHRIASPPPLLQTTYQPPPPHRSLFTRSNHQTHTPYTIHSILLFYFTFLFIDYCSPSLPRFSVASLQDINKRQCAGDVACFFLLDAANLSLVL